MVVPVPPTDRRPATRSLPTSSGGGSSGEGTEVRVAKECDRDVADRT